MAKALFLVRVRGTICYSKQAQVSVKKLFSVLAQSNVGMMERRGPATPVFPSLQPSGFSTGSSVFGREMDKEASMQGLVILEARPGTVVYAGLPTFHWPELKSHVPSKCVGSGECSQAVDQRK